MKIELKSGNNTATIELTAGELMEVNRNSKEILTLILDKRFDVEQLIDRIGRTIRNNRTTTTASDLFAKDLDKKETL